MKPDRAWEIWGSCDPYYAVLTDERYHAAALSEADREAFFQSGARHIDWLLEQFDRGGERLPRRRAMDFGCGVGRLLVPLATHFQAATGVDIARSMREEAQRNCASFGIDNVVLQDTAQMLAADQDYDLVHSVLVLQHVRPREADRLLGALAARVAPGGALAVQLVFRPFGPKRLLASLKNRIPFGHALALWARGRPRVVAPMEMHTSNLNRVMALLQDQSFPEVRLLLSRAGVIGNVLLLARRTGSH